MYTPRHFVMPEHEYASFIEKFPLASLISAHNLATSQCPLVYVAEKQQLIGHLSIANSQLSAFEQNSQVKVIFTGDNGYISAAWYPTPDQVPTWNYSALEVSGTINLLAEDEALTILEKLTQVFEASVNEDWRIDKLSGAQRDAMVKAIRAFTIDIDNWQGVEKLSQNKSIEVRQHLLEQSGKLASPLYQDLINNN